MADDTSFRSPEAQRKLGGSQYPGNEEDPVDATVHGCGLPVVIAIVGGIVILLL